MSNYTNTKSASSKKPHKKSNEQVYANDYEHEVVRHHSQLPDTEAWHWSRAPEELLYDSGYISSFSKERHERLMRKKKAEEGVNRVRDYGFDGIARTMTSTGYVYNGIQAKYYHKTKVTAGDIGSFLAMQMKLYFKNNQSKGYLYTTTHLESSLADTVADPNYFIRHILHPWKHPDAKAIEQHETPQRQECDLPLRPYQEDALKQLQGKYGINLLDIPCGMGKTLISAHHLKGFNSSLIVAIAPLKVSVKNLQDRLTCFLPTYKFLLVDSDTDGTTNLEEIKRFLEEGDSNKIIYSTYDSAVEILSEIITCYEDAFCLADEIHNANEKICEFINCFPNGLIMSATIPVEILEEIEVNHIVSIPVSYGIKEGYLVDYTVWLPHLVKASDGTTSVDLDIPVEFTVFNRELTAKALYLAVCMLKNGSRCCIAYMSSQLECDAFMEIVSTVFQNYHGLDVWTNKIDSTTPSKERTTILEEFQNGNSGRYHILTSIRILDEAIDIPGCDSEFVTSIGEHSSDIRMMQRSMRGSRLDSKNPSKRNNVFLWADGWEKCVGALELLREADPEFHKKVRIADCNYDRNDSSERVEMIKGELLEFEKWRAMECSSLWQRNLLRITQIQNFIKKHGTYPKTKGIRDEGHEKILMTFIASLRANKKSGTLNSILEKEVLEKLPDFEWNVFAERHSKRIYLLQQFHNSYNEHPNHGGNRVNEKQLANYISNLRTQRRRGELKEHIIKQINDLCPWFIWDLDKTLYDTMVDLLDKFYKKYNEPPKNKGLRENETIMYRFVSKCRENKKKGKLSVYLEGLINERFSAWWIWDVLEEIFINNIKELEGFFKKHNESPKNQGIRENEHILSRCIGTWRLNKKKSILTKEQEEQIVEKLPWLSWDPLYEQNICKINEVESFIKTHNHLPVSKGTKDNGNEASLASYVIKSRVLYKENKLHKEYILLIQDKWSPWFKWNHFEDKYISIINEIQTFIDINKKLPSSKAANDKGRESVLGSYIIKFRRDKKNGILGETIIKAIEEKLMPLFNWGGKEEQRQILLNNINKFYGKYKEEPRQNGKREGGNEKKWADYIYQRRNDKKKGELSEELVSFIEKILPWFNW